jgi:multidrug efflux system membrane fusion protein
MRRVIACTAVLVFAAVGIEISAQSPSASDPASGPKDAKSDSRAQTQAGAPGSPAASTPPAPPEGNEYVDFVGRTEAVQTIEVHPAVPGLLTRIAFQEGQDIQKGDLLFEFDSRPHQAALDLAAAELALARAELTVAEADLARQRQLLKAAAVSEAEIDKAAAHAAAARAALLAVEAKLQSARLNLEATRLVSPIAGHIGRAYLSVGNWVLPGATLAVIVSLDPIHVSFDVDERQYLQLSRRWRETGRSTPAKPPRVPVKIGLSVEPDFPRKGVVDFVDNQFEPKTGTIRFRAVLANPDRLMLPGLFVRVRMPLETPQKQ